MIVHIPVITYVDDGLDSINVVVDNAQTTYTSAYNIILEGILDRGALLHDLNTNFHLDYAGNKTASVVPEVYIVSRYADFSEDIADYRIYTRVVENNV